MTLHLLFAAVIGFSVTGCDTASASHATANPNESVPAEPVPPADGVTLVKELGAKDSIVLLRVDSQIPAMVTIFRCTIEKTVHGPTLPAEITMSFLHFPNCRRMAVGSRYLCVIRGDSYELVRSDMLGGTAKEDMYNCFWLAESDKAKQVVAGVKKTE